ALCRRYPRRGRGGGAAQQRGPAASLRGNPMEPACARGVVTGIVPRAIGRADTIARAEELTVNRRHNLVWIDLEMTGLNPDTDCILEIATVVTDKDLIVLDEGPVCAINQPDEVLGAMDEWNTRQHGSSGLIERVRASWVTAQEAEQQTLQFLR